MAGLNFDITGDNSNFLRKLEEARNGITSTSKQIEKEGTSIEAMFGRMAKGAAALGAGFSAQQFASQIMRVRGEFQQLEVAFKTMLGSKEKADALMSQLVKTAATTPFDLQSVAGGAKQLLAYGTSAEDVNGTLVQLGDIAAGLSIPLNDLVYLYGTTMTQGRLFTQDLRQFQGRGIPLADELAKQFGVTKDKVGELVTAGKVGFPEVQKAIVAMTSDGGKFGGLMEAQSKTITGQISNIEDSISTMYNNIGKSSEGFINDALSGASYLIENYETIGKTILELAATYGAYKAVLMSVAAYQSFAVGVTYTAEIAELSKLIPLKQQSANEDVIAAVASGKLTQSKAAQVIALRAEISAKIQSLQATEAQTKAEYASAMASYKNATQRMLLAKQNMAIAQSQMSIAIKSGTADEIAAAKKNAQTASQELNNAAVAKNTTHKSLNAAATNRKSASEALNTLETGKNSVAQVVNTTSTNILTAAKTKLAAASKALGLSMLANPYVLAAAAVVGLGYGIYKLITHQTDAEKAQSKLNDTVREFNRQTATENAEINRLFDKLRNTNKEASSYQKTKDEIIKKYGGYLDGLNQEVSKLNDIEVAYRAISAAARQAAVDRAITKATQEAQDDWADSRGSVIDKLKNSLTSGGTMTDGAAEAFIETINRELKETGRLSDETTKKIEKYNYTITHPETGEIIGSGNSVSWAIDALKKNDKALDDLYSKINSKFGINTNEYENLGKSDIDAYIKGFENALSNFKRTGNKQTVQLKTGWVSFGSEEELELQLNKLRSVKDSFDKNNSANSEQKAGTEWLSSYKKSYMDAEKAYNDFLKSKQVMSDADRDKELKRLKEDRDAAKATYESKGGSTSSDTKEESATDKLRQEQEKSAEELLSLRRKNQQDEIDLIDEGTEKKIKQIELDYQKELDAIKKQEKEFTKDNGGKMTSEQSSHISTAYTNAENERIKGIAEANKAELEAMRDYLKEYGTFQQQKLAIAEEYAEKISKAQTEGDRLKLEKERDSAIQSKEIEVIKQSIDWQGVFGNLTGMLDSQLKETLSGLKEYVKTDKFKSSSETDMKTVYDAIEQLQSITPGGEGTLNFNKIQQQMNELGAAINRLQTATLNQEIAYEKSRKAQEDYDNALKSGDKGTIDSAKQALDLAKLGANAASDAYASAEVDVQNFGNNLRSTSEDTVDGLNLVASGLQNFANGSLPEIFRGLQNTVSGLSKINIGGEVGNAIGTLSKTLSSAGVIGQIISAILSILDILKDGIGPLISGIIDSILGAVDGILSNILSGDLFVQIFSSLKDGIGNILNTITFGGFDSWFGADGNSKEVNELVSNLTESNKYLITAIDKLTDEMEKSGGKKATEYYESAVGKQEEKTENDRQMLAARMGRSASHHSNSYYINKAFNSDDWKKASDYVGKQMKSAGDLWKLTPEELAKLQELPDIWQKINSGKYDESSYLDAYIENAEKIEELTSKWHESLNQMSLDSFRDGFLSTLEDMDASSEDFAQNFENYLKKSILNALIADKYAKDIEGLYDAWAEAGEDGEYTKEEADALREKQQKIADAILAERDAMADTFGWTSEGSTSQDSTKGMSQSMSQDTGDELNGRFTAFQISNEEIKNSNEEIKNSMLYMLVSMNLISVSTNTSGITLMEIKNIALMSNSHLEDIAKYTKELIGFKQTIANIETSAKAMAGK